MIHQWSSTPQLCLSFTADSIQSPTVVTLMQLFHSLALLARNSVLVVSADRAIFVLPWKMVSVSVLYLFYQPMDEKIKTLPLRFPAKYNPKKEKALFDWLIVLQYDVKAKYRLFSRKFSRMKFYLLSIRVTNQKPRAFVFRSINQSNCSISVRLLFLLCSRVSISRSYENCSDTTL